MYGGTTDGGDVRRPQGSAQVGTLLFGNSLTAFDNGVTVSPCTLKLRTVMVTLHGKELKQVAQIHSHLSFGKKKTCTHQI